MSTISQLLEQLEAAINAVEPRVLENYYAGLSEIEIDAIVADEPFALPDDLRALYQWRNGGDSVMGFLDLYIWMLPLKSQEPSGNLPKPNLKVVSDGIREEIQMFYEDKPTPFDLNSKHYVYLFDDGGDGTYILAVFSPDGKNCELWRFIPSDWPALELYFDNILQMVETALEWWRSGVFSSQPFPYSPGWTLEVNEERYEQIGQRLNPNYFT